ncbi:LamG-like jellyroll fold domain-containing protein [Kitasatospora sp. NPDC059577]|uniref:LamG-like jellyroll fold domain-containing protein n=1 Tax=Kitasatospora sp. NPDC059577 TaxID=3346873 RepID=UPI003681CB1A
MSTDGCPTAGSDPLGSADLFEVLSGGLTPVYDRGMERRTLPLAAAEPVPGVVELHPLAYDFAHYADRWGREPDAPRYLLAPTRTTGEAVTVEVAFGRTGASEETVETTEARFPAGWPGGDAVAVELPGRADEFTHALRITAIRPRPPAPQGAGDWRLTVLLGNLAKLLWVVGRDYQDVTRRLADVAAQRNAHSARAAGLDLLGQDLGAPRFPPRPYSWDDRTVALYHFDDVPPDGSSEVLTVADAGGRFGATPHDGTNEGARPGRAGRFSRAFGFGPDGGISVPDHPDLAVAADADLTAEAVVRPDRAATGTGTVLAKRDRLDPAAPGWSLTIGGFRGIDHNLRLSLGDGTRHPELFADRDLGDGRFHHLAATLRRTPDGTVVGLYLDGVQVTREVVPGLGALTSHAPLLIGRFRETTPTAPAAAQYQGLIEEVRLSKTARTCFDPVTGEGDEHYRHRLELFQRWLVPTPYALQDALNRAAGRVRGDPPPADDPHAPPTSFEIDETTGAIATGSLDLRVLPAPLTTGQSITADGDRLRSEAEAVGTAAEESDFDPGWLCRHPGATGLAFADDNGRLMQLGVRRALDALLTRLGLLAPCTLTVVRGYDPSATDDLCSVGRALLLRLDGPGGPAGPGPTAELGVQAHAAGFGWVGHTADGLLRVAQPAGDAFAITLTTDPAAPPLPGTDLTCGQSADLVLDPDPSGLPDVALRWSVTSGGPGTAKVERAPGRPAALRAGAAGDVTVTVEAGRSGHTRTGRRVVRIGVTEAELTAAGSISRDGRLGATEAQAAGALTEDFDPAYLQLRTDDLTAPPRRVVFGPDPGARRMQPAAGAALDRLLDLLGPTAGSLHVLAAFDPAPPGQPDHGLAGQGRVLELTHDTLSAQALAVRAFAAGADHVALPPPDTGGGPATVRIAVAAGGQLRAAVVGATRAVGSAGAEVRVTETVTVDVTPRVAPAAACLAPDGGRLFLSDPGRHRVLAVQLSATAPTELPVPTLSADRPVRPLPGALAFAGGWLIVAHRALGRLDALDPVTLEPVRSIVDLPAPTALATDGARLFVACAGDTSLRAFDVESLEQTGSLDLWGTPTALATGPNSPVLVVLFDGGGFCLVTRTALQIQGGMVDAGVKARCAAFASDGTRLYVGADPAIGGTTGSVRVFTNGATAPSAVVDGFPPGTVPVAMCPATGRRQLYVATADPGATTAGRIHVLGPLAHPQAPSKEGLLPTAFDPGGDCRVLAASPPGAPYRPCLLAAVESTAAVLLADQTPLSGDPPRPPQLAARLVPTLEPDTQLTWATAPVGPGRAEPRSPESPVTRVAGRAPGLVRLTAAYLRGSPVLPYQCEVRLRSDLEARPPQDVVVSKDQYDLVLNILNWFQPLGIEFRTGRLRRHVRELADAEPGLLPAYTFPAYRTGDRRLRAFLTAPAPDDQRSDGSNDEYGTNDRRR